jgi:two-component system chemotaxis sensor kinase CheA
MGDGLAAIAERATDAETVNAVFRAVHSIKGAAGAVGRSDNVALTHSFETVLDAIRSDRLVAEPEVQHLLQRAGDVLADLLEAARDDRPDLPEALPAILDLLEEIGSSNDDSVAEDFVFEPIGLAFPDEDAGPETQGFDIAFRPGPSFFTNGHESANLFAALAELGDLTVDCDTSGLPPLAEIDPDGSYLAWTLRLATASTIDEVRDVFAFVEGLCALEITSSEAALPTAPDVSEPPQLAELPTEEPLPRPPETQATAAAPAVASPPSREAPRPTLRVELDRVDRLINSVGELIINQAVIAQKIAEAHLPRSSALGSHVEDLTLLARDIQEGVMRIRAQPLKPLFQRMARVLREAAESTGKQVDFITEGEDTEVDRTVIEGLGDPLMHMLRNAVDHGIETPAEREAKGKSPKGRLVLSASHASGNVRIVIRDDGAGLNRPRIKEIAARKGLIPPEAALSETEIDSLLFLPGFSTAASVTNLSGRGVGLDVVRNSVAALGGRIAISSRTGEGTTFSISLPLTLAVLDGLIVSVADQLMVIPVSAILETVRPAESDFLQVRPGHRVLAMGERHVPLLDVASLLEFGPSPDPARAVVVLVRTGEEGQVALTVAGIVDKRQVVIKSLRHSVGTVAGTSAATILGDGKVALILDPDALLAISARRRTSPPLDHPGSDHERAA